jgi:hypothetical protein
MSAHTVDFPREKVMSPNTQPITDVPAVPDPDPPSPSPAAEPDPAAALIASPPNPGPEVLDPPPEDEDESSLQVTPLPELSG